MPASTSDKQFLNPCLLMSPEDYSVIPLTNYGSLSLRFLRSRARLFGKPPAYCATMNYILGRSYPMKTWIQVLWLMNLLMRTINLMNQ